MVAAFLQFNSITTLFVSMATDYGDKFQSDHSGEKWILASKWGKILTQNKRHLFP